MKRDELTRIVESTADPTFAVDSEGLVAAWNSGAERLFGAPATDAVGKRCGELLRGRDECGEVCSDNCTIRQAIDQRHAVGNFDLEVRTVSGRQWCNVSVLSTEDNGSTRPVAIHVVRPIDLRKRLELLMRDFVVSATSVTPESATAMIAATRAPAKDTQLSVRELEILRLVAQGKSSIDIADQLSISRTTVNNHIQHILQKLNVHNRLEAIRRAEHAGLI